MGSLGSKQRGVIMPKGIKVPLSPYVSQETHNWIKAKAFEDESSTATVAAELLEEVVGEKIADRTEDE